MTAVRPAPADRVPAPPLTAQLVDWAASVRFADLPDAVVHQAKRVVLDYVAATLVGSTSEPARVLGVSKTRVRFIVARLQDKVRPFFEGLDDREGT